jgi:predicted deacylase
VATPILNPGAFRALRRTNPLDDVDLNRIWAAEGLPFATEQLRRVVQEEVLAHADVLVDLHSGGNRFLQGAFTIYPSVGGGVEERSAALARSCGIPLIWAHRGSILEGGLITAAARQGKPSVLVEVAGEGKAEEAWIATMAMAVEGIMAQLGILGKPVPRLPRYRVFHDFATVTCRHGGLWRRRAEPGVLVAQGQPLGQVLDPFGQVLEEVRWPGGPGEVLGICTYGAVASGDYIAEIALGIREEPPG